MLNDREYFHATSYSLLQEAAKEPLADKFGSSSERELLGRISSDIELMRIVFWWMRPGDAVVDVKSIGFESLVYPH